MFLRNPGINMKSFLFFCNSVLARARTLPPLETRNLRPRRLRKALENSSNNVPADQGFVFFFRVNVLCARVLIFPGLAGHQVALRGISHSGLA